MKHWGGVRELPWMKFYCLVRDAMASTRGRPKVGFSLAEVIVGDRTSEPRVTLLWWLSKGCSVFCTQTPAGLCIVLWTIHCIVEAVWITLLKNQWLYFWLHWLSIVAWAFSSCGEVGGLLSRCDTWLLIKEPPGWVVVAPELRCPTTAGEIFPAPQGLNLCPGNRRVDS